MKFLRILILSAALLCGGVVSYAQKNYPKLRPIRESGQESFYTLAQNKSGFWGYVNSEGKKVIPYVFNAAETFTENGVAKVMYDQWWGVVDITGQYLLIPVNDDVIFPDRKRPDCIITVNRQEDSELYTIYSHSGEQLHEIPGSGLSIHKNAQFSIRTSEGVMLYFNGEGRRLDYRDIKLYDAFKAGTDSLWTATMADGSKVLLDNRWLPVFDETAYMLDGDSYYMGKSLMYVVRNRLTSHLGLMDSKGGEVIPCEYDRLYMTGNYLMAELSTPRSSRLFSTGGQLLFGPADELSFNGSYIYTVVRGQISVTGHDGSKVASGIDRNSFSGRFFDEVSDRFVMDRTWKSVDGHVSLLYPADKDSYPSVEDFLPLPMTRSSVEVRTAPVLLDEADSLVRLRLDSLALVAGEGVRPVVFDHGWYSVPDTIDIDRPLVKFDEEGRTVWTFAPQEAVFTAFRESACALYLISDFQEGDGSVDRLVCAYSLRDFSLLKKGFGRDAVIIGVDAERHLLVRKASELWGNRNFVCYTVEASDGSVLGLCHGMESQKIFGDEVQLEFGNDSLVISWGFEKLVLTPDQPDGTYEYLL